MDVPARVLPPSSLPTVPRFFFTALPRSQTCLLEERQLTLADPVATTAPTTPTTSSPTSAKMYHKVQQKRRFSPCRLAIEHPFSETPSTRGSGGSPSL